MKIKEVRIKDFKCLKDFNAELGGHNVILLGDNEVGKSSLLQWIKISLGDKTCIPPNANGSGEMVVELYGKPVTFKLDLENGVPYIKVTGDGISINNNKSAIAQLVGANSFNPDEFVKLSESVAGRKQQIEEFKNKFIDEAIRIDLAKHENNAKNYYAERTEINRDIVKLEGAVKLNPMLNHLHELDKFCPIDTSEVMEQLKSAQATNTKITEVKQRIDSREKDIQSNTNKVKELQTQIDALNTVTDDLIKKQSEATEWLKSNHLINTKPFEDTINNATEINKKASDAENLKKQLKEIETLKETSGQLTVMIDTSKQMITDTIRDLDSLIPGLGFDEEQLVYNGVPVHPNSMSTSQRAQLAVILKRAENPNMPILLECSESWGQKKFDWLRELSESNDFQFIAEKVESGVEKLELRILADAVEKS